MTRTEKASGLVRRAVQLTSIRDVIEELRTIADKNSDAFAVELLKDVEDRMDRRKRNGVL